MRARRRNWPIEDLRRSIDCLPVRTRIAMLEGVRGNDIIVGAYVDRNGGVCPMLAAHRHGGRTDFLSFARAWDRFTGAKRRARRATEREVRILVSHLEASLLAEDAALDLESAIVEHREALERRRAERRPGDAFRAPELKARWGWSWLRPFRRLDDYERALSRFEAERDAVEREREPA